MASNAEVAAAVSRSDQVRAFAKKHQIAQTYRDYRALLADPVIDVVDICTPPALHARMIVDAVRAGKHVICEKPFTGYFGRPGDKTPIGRNVAKSLMYERVMEEMERTSSAIRSSGRLFMYAEDWVYAPAVAKTVEILRATKDKILFMKGDESHSGSHAAHAAQWAMTGGGSLVRMGCHPLSAALYLKQVEAQARGERITVAAVSPRAFVEYARRRALQRLSEIIIVEVAHHHRNLVRRTVSHEVCEEANRIGERLFRRVEPNHSASNAEQIVSKGKRSHFPRSLAYVARMERVSARSGIPHFASLHAGRKLRRYATASVSLT